MSDEVVSLQSVVSIKSISPTVEGYQFLTAFPIEAINWADKHFNTSTNRTKDLWSKFTNLCVEWCNSQGIKPSWKAMYDDRRMKGIPEKAVNLKQVTRSLSPFGERPQGNYERDQSGTRNEISGPYQKREKAAYSSAPQAKCQHCGSSNHRQEDHEFTRHLMKPVKTVHPHPTAEQLLKIQSWLGTPPDPMLTKFCQLNAEGKVEEYFKSLLSTPLDSARSPQEQIDERSAEYDALTKYRDDLIKAQGNYEVNLSRSERNASRPSPLSTESKTFNSGQPDSPNRSPSEFKKIGIILKNPVA